MWETIKNGVHHLWTRIDLLIRWVLFSILSGILIGAVGSLFVYGLQHATDTRAEHPWILLFLPLAGVFIVWCYHVLRNETDSGTNLVLSAIHSGENIPLKMAPLIFISTILTHFTGGSAGREGAALQIGGSIGHSLGRLFQFDEKDQHIMIMCGMSAAFSAVFGTPLAAAIFSMEVVSVGIMHYSALVPCVVSSLVASAVSHRLGILPEHFSIAGQIPDFTLISAVKISLLAALAAGVSVLFCVALHSAEALYKKFLKNPYLRAGFGGVLVILLTLLVGSQDYNGAGMFIIDRCFAHEAVPYAFLLKILFTALTLGAGFKGGEIVPTFFIGATFGCTFGNLLGFSPDLCTAVGMGAVFCGVTNCPLTSLFICFELFGFAAMPYYLLAIAISYMLSGYYGLYRSQKIMYSKYKTEYINRKTH
ncbi:MAG: chloride channel protein [Lachnospiraceae bacterium]|nr:chloride channel protein [Lachnospiraceae bacterium]MCI9151800.1 chloride channel protein [Lachnospiraceae bacterium]